MDEEAYEAALGEIHELEEQVDELEAKVDDLKAEVARLKTERDESDALRANVVTAAVDSSKTVVRALDEIVELTKVVAPAIAWRAAHAIPGSPTESALAAAADAWVARARTRS